MDLIVALERRDPAVVVQVAGEIDLSNAPSLERELLGALHDADALVIDLHRVDYLDSSALACLHRIFLASGDRKVPMRVVTGGNGVSRRLLAMTGLDRELQTSDSIDEAMRSLGAPPDR